MVGSYRWVSRIAFALAVMVGLAAKATVIGVNFIGANNGGGASVTGTAGVVPQANWNNEANATGTDSAVITDAGSTAGVTLTWNGNNTWATGHAGLNQDGDLLQGYLDDLTTHPWTVSMGVPASIAGAGSTPYDVIVYLAGDTAGRGGTYTVNGQSAILVTSGPEADGVLKLATPATDTSGTGAVEGNYYIFSGVTGTTLSMSTTPLFSGANMRTPLNGFQLVDAASVPEPVGASALVVIALGIVRRRK